MSINIKNNFSSMYESAFISPSSFSTKEKTSASYGDQIEVDDIDDSINETNQYDSSIDKSDINDQNTNGKVESLFFTSSTDGKEINSDIFSLEEKKQLNILSTQISSLLGYSEETSSQFARVIAHYLKPDSDYFIKKTKKEAQTPNGFSVSGSSVYIHSKAYIGEGNFKTTYLAFLINTETGQAQKTVHQKVKRATSVQMTQREVKIQQQFDHPHIVKIYGSYLSNSGLGCTIYAEKCSLCNLEKHLSRGSLNQQQKLVIAADIASALSYVHRQGYSHNDIKPDNILIKNKRGKLADFGLCKPIGEAFNGFKKIYAPEQENSLESKRVANDKTDAYQFGLTLWHLFHPNPPTDHLESTFAYPTGEELFNNWPIQSPVDSILQDLIRECIDTDPSVRPSMDEIEEKLLEALMLQTCSLSGK